MRRVGLVQRKSVCVCVEGWYSVQLEELKEITHRTLCVCVVLPSDSPPCSWLTPAGAAAPPRRWSVVGPAPGRTRREATKTRLRREQREFWGGSIAGPCGQINVRMHE